MWDAAKQSRFNALRAAQRHRTLTTGEGAELSALTQELDALEGAYLHPATQRIRREREEQEEQNTKLEDLLREQQTYLAEVRAVVTELTARQQQWRARYAAITGQEWTAGQAETSG
jgi:hypothetical protein